MSAVKSKLETNSREFLITEVMKFDIQAFADMPQSEVEGWISHTLLNGFKGFNNMTDSELEQCYEEVKKHRGYFENES